MDITIAFDGKQYTASYVVQRGAVTVTWHDRLARCARADLCKQKTAENEARSLFRRILSGARERGPL